jgi:predicted lipid-binding transport protein (Tim44 family)
MIFLFAAIVLLGVLVWRGRVGRVLKGEWRAPAAIVAIGLFAAAGFEALRGGAAAAFILLIVGLLLLGTARWPRPVRPRARADQGMSESDARSVLGVGPDAAEAEIRAAHARLIRINHPDTGGTTGLAAQLNAARDRLLKR